MPIYNLGTIISTATNMAGGRVWPLSEASLWANQAAEIVGNQVSQLEKESLAYSSTTSGENRIERPTDYDYGISLSNISLAQGSDRRTLIRQQAVWFDSQGTTLGIPTHWADYGTWIELNPPPDSGYSLALRYVRKTPTMVDSTDTLPFQPEYHTGVLYKTVELLEASRNNLEGEAIAGQRYISYMGSLMNDRAKRQQAPQGMVVRFLRQWD